MKPLYEISEQYSTALRELEDADLPQEVIQDTLEGLSGDLQEKSKNVALWIANREYEVQAVQEAAEKLSERASREKKALENMKTYLKYHMDANGITEISSPEVTVKIKLNPPKVVIDDESKLDEFKFTKTTVCLNKKALKEALKDGDVEGAHLEQETRIEIK